MARAEWKGLSDPCDATKLAGSLQLFRPCTPAASRSLPRLLASAAANQETGSTGPERVGETGWLPRAAGVVRGELARGAGSRSRELRATVRKERGWCSRRSRLLVGKKWLLPCRARFVFPAPGPEPAGPNPPPPA